MLISMPTGTSTIFGVFQAIWLSFLDPDAFRPAYKLVPNEKIASEIFFFDNGAGDLCCIAKDGAEPRPMAANLPFINDFSGISGALRRQDEGAPQVRRRSKCQR
jgi:hypothetical protein